jgi:hypothetical protein
MIRGMVRVAWWRAVITDDVEPCFSAFDMSRLR